MQQSSAQQTTRLKKATKQLLDAEATILRYEQDTKAASEHILELEEAQISGPQNPNLAPMSLWAEQAIVEDREQMAALEKKLADQSVAMSELQTQIIHMDIAQSTLQSHRTLLEEQLQEARSHEASDTVIVVLCQCEFVQNYLAEPLANLHSVRYSIKASDTPQGCSPIPARFRLEGKHLKAQAEYDFVYARLSKVQEQCLELEGQISVLKKDERETANRIADMSEKASELQRLDEDRVKELEKECEEALEVVYAELLKSQEQCLELKGQMEDKEETANLMAVMSEKASELQRLHEDRVKELEMERDEDRASIMIKQRQCEDFEQDIRHLKETKTHMETRISEIRDLYDARVRELDELQTILRQRIKQLERKSEDSEEIKHDLERKIRNVTKQASDYQDGQARAVKELEKQLEKNAATIKHLKENKLDLEMERDTLHDKMVEFWRRCKEYEVSLFEFSSTIPDFIIETSGRDSV
ncbi:hypothetical protein B0H11DRAFT_2265472 [Mycena galericulata]|nr:hypothetical protein B0H11DRAFT_2265472 [Mycena galericulata]